MRELSTIEVEQVDGGIVGLILGAVGVYLGALSIVQNMGASSGAANARRNAE